jgi:hypothetical protein
MKEINNLKIVVFLYTKKLKKEEKEKKREGCFD